MLHWFLSLSTRVPVPRMHSNGLSLNVPGNPLRSAVARHTGSLLSDGNPVNSSAEFLNMMTVSTGYPEQTRAPIQTYHTGLCVFLIVWVSTSGSRECPVVGRRALDRTLQLQGPGHAPVDTLSKSFLSSSLFPGSTTVCSRHSSGALTRFWMRLLASQRALDRSRYLFLRLPASQRALGSFRYLLLRLPASPRALDRSRVMHAWSAADSWLQS